MRIEVTQEHIDKGTPEDACNCPVALAIREALKAEAEEIRVHHSDIWIWGDLYNTSEAVERFVWNFDVGVSVAPFTFDLPIEEVSKS